MLSCAVLVQIDTVNSCVAARVEPNATAFNIESFAGPLSHFPLESLQISICQSLTSGQSRKRSILATVPAFAITGPFVGFANSVGLALKPLPSVR